MKPFRAIQFACYNLVAQPVGVATLVAVIISYAAATLITHVAKYKISLHIDSAAGAVTVCCLLTSPIFLALSPLVMLIAWARCKLEAHSPLQAI